MKKLEMNQMEKIEGGGCWGFAAGALATFAGGPLTATVGFMVMLDQAAECEEWLYS